MDNKGLNAVITGRINEYIAEMHNFSLSGEADEAVYLQELQELVDVCNEKSKELECALKALLNALNKK